MPRAPAVPGHGEEFERVYEPRDFRGAPTPGLVLRESWGWSVVVSAEPKRRRQERRSCVTVPVWHVVLRRPSADEEAALDVLRS